MLEFTRHGFTVGVSARSWIRGLNGFRTVSVWPIEIPRMNYLVILRIPYVVTRASMSNAVYEVCPVTGRVLDKNRLLCPTRSKRISMRARIDSELWTRRTYCTSARTVFRTLIDESRLDFVRSEFSHRGCQYFR